MNNLTSSKPQRIKTYVTEDKDCYLFCNQYEDSNIVYTLYPDTAAFSVYDTRVLSHYSDKLSTSGSTQVTRDQWNKFLTTMRLLSATVLAAIHDDKRNVFDYWYMKSEQDSNKSFISTYTIRLLRQRGIVLINEEAYNRHDINNRSNLLIPFNQTLKDRILKYQQDLKVAVTDILGIKLTTT